MSLKLEVSRLVQVKPLSRSGLEILGHGVYAEYQDSKAVHWVANLDARAGSADLGKFATEDDAWNSCQAHRESQVLNMIELRLS